MDYLAIVQKLANLADISYSDITDVSTLTGELAIAADWAKHALFSIQAKHDGHWKFLHTEYLRATRASDLIDASAATDIGGGVVGIPVTGHGFSSGDYVRIHGTTNYDGTYTVESSTTTNVVHITATYMAETFAGTEQIQVRDYEFYTADSVKDFDKDSFYYYLKTDGANKTSPLRYMNFKDFSKKYIDYEDAETPQVVTITPNKRLRIYPAPDAIYMIGANAYSVPTELSSNTDTPPFDVEFHDLVVYKALIDYAGFEESSAIWTWASSRFAEDYKELEWQQLDDGEDKVVRAV